MATFDIQDGVLVKAKGMDRIFIVPEGVTTIADHAFHFNNVEEIIFPEGVQKICNYAINYCHELKRIVIPSSVTNIEPQALFQSGSGVYGCKIEVAEANPVYSSEGNCLIEKATGTLLAGFCNTVIPKSVKKIGDGAFSGYMKHIVIPNTVREIGKNAFACLTSLESVEIQEGVRTIGDGAFNQCTSLIEIKFPSTVRKIGKDLLIECNDLKRIEVAENNSYYYAKGNCLIERATNTLIAGCQTSVIPDGVERIADMAFWCCQVPSKMIIPGSVKVVGDSAFQRSGIRYLEIQEGVTKLDAYAFWECWELKSVKLPSTLTEIGQSAFADTAIKKVVLPSGLKVMKEILFENTALESIVIPEGVTTIKHRAFASCERLKSITISSTVTKIDRIAFIDCPAIEMIKVSKENPVFEAKGGCLINKTTGDILVIYKNEVAIPDGITKIKNGTFQYFKSLVKVVLPASIQKIGKEAFSGCEALAEIVLSDNLTTIAEAAFSKCKELKHLDIPKGVTKIGESAFAECLHLESVMLPDTLKTLGDGVFAECYLLKELTIPNSVTKIGKNILRLTNPQTLTLPRRFENVISTLGVDTNKTKVIYTED